MDYVMVPVPEDLVVDVMQHVARLVAQASAVAWDDDAAASLFDSVDEASRSLLAMVARHVVANKDLSEDDAASSLELSGREVRSIVRDLGETAKTEKRGPIVAIREVPTVLRNGRSVERRLLVMDPQIARVIRSRGRPGSADLGAEAVSEPATDLPE
ncbi:MAG: hypothetical protein EXQ71_07320 [Acidimicrobiia bacterium]|nr:hypothetical protein [Acidimicrobiia bacterium]